MPAGWQSLRPSRLWSWFPPEVTHRLVCGLVIFHLVLLLSSGGARFIARPHRSVVQHSGSASQDLDPPTADAAQEVELRITPVGAVAANGVIVGLGDQQALVGTWSRAKSGTEMVQHSAYARSSAPRPEDRCALR